MQFISWVSRYGAARDCGADGCGFVSRWVECYIVFPFSGNVTKHGVV